LNRRFAVKGIQYDVAPFAVSYKPSAPFIVEPFGFRISG
jgi:hypothetical protein